MKIESALSIALGIILVPIIVIGFIALSSGSILAGSSVAEGTKNPLPGFIVGVGIFGFVIWGIVACVG